MSSNTNRFVSIETAAEKLAISPRTVWRRIADGTITGYRLGRLIRIDLAELDAALRPIPTTRRAA